MDQKKNEQKKGHPNICPKCKYHRPLGLSFCPHCRELETKPKGVIITEHLQKMGVTVGDAKILPSNNTNNDRPNTQRENTQQKKPETANREKVSKLQGLPRARKRATKSSIKSKH
jgi:hypothetical protein